MSPTRHEVRKGKEDRPPREAGATGRNRRHCCSGSWCSGLRSDPVVISPDGQQGSRQLIGFK